MSRIQELRKKLGLSELKQRQPTPEQVAMLQPKDKPQQKDIPQPVAIPHVTNEPSRLFRAILNLDLCQIDPLEFERFLQLTFEIFGFTATLTPASGDHGIDIKLVSPSGSLCVVQCKRYRLDQCVSPKEVREFLGALIFFKADFGFFVTTSYFTDQCKEFSTNQPIFLVDQPLLRNLLLFAETVELNRGDYEEELKYPERMLGEFFRTPDLTVQIR